MSLSSPLRSLKDQLFLFVDERRFWEVMRDHCATAGKHRPWSFETWEALIAAARERGLFAAPMDDAGNVIKPIKWAGIFGPMLVNRVLWLEDAKARGITPEQAAREYDAKIDAAHAKDRKREEDEIRDRIERGMRDRSRGRVRGVVEAEI